MWLSSCAVDEQGKVTTTTYTGPKLPPYNSSKRPAEGNAPVYVDGQGRLYDRFYRPFTDAYSREQLSQRLSHAGSFPSHLNYAKYSEYKAAVLAWHQRVREGLGDLRLPQLMGRTYPRPRVSKLNVEQLEEEVEDEMNVMEDDVNGGIFPLSTDDLMSPRSLAKEAEAETSGQLPASVRACHPNWHRS